MKKFFAILFCCLLTPKANSQVNDSEAFLYNISIGGVFGTIGSIINKSQNEKIDKVILKGFAQGVLGGYLTFESKRLLRVATDKEEWKYILGSKILNSAGNSILENAALNRKFGEQWNLNIGFIRLEIRPKDEKKIMPKIMPIAFIYTIGAAFQTKFELNKSLKSGQFIFSTNDKRFEETNSIGVTFPGVIILKYDNRNQYSVLTHEIVHVYQQNDFNVLNTYLDKPIKKLNSKNNFLNNFIYYDFQIIPIYFINTIENNNRKEYFDNYLEHEAGYFSNTLQ